MDAEKKPAENPGWRRLREWAGKTVGKISFQEDQKIYVLTLLIGGASGLSAVSFHLLLGFFQDHIIYYVASIPGWWGVLLVLLVPALGGLIAGAGLYFYAPEARGSGIPQVKASYYLDGGRIPARVIPGKMFLAAFNIGTGASLGREGPTVQICAAIASWLGRVFRVSRRRLRSLLPMGAAAGLAAAFNTPIAAVTFVLEEILGGTAGTLLGPIVIASVIAAVIEHSMLGAHPLFNVPPYKLNQASELVSYALLGIAAGVASVAFNEGLLYLRRRFLRQSFVPQWATPGVGGLIVGGIGLSAVLLTGSSSIFGIGYNELSTELHGTLPLKVVAFLGACKLAATVISYSSGSSGGIFAPSLYIGGMLGGGVGLLTQLALGGSATEPGAFALVGMGAVFAGVVRAPVTSIIMIFEMTNNYSIILPLMVANIISYLLSTRLSPTPLYDALLLQDGIHLHRERGILLRSLRPELAVRLNVRSVEELFGRLVDRVAEVAPSLSREETVRDLLEREKLFPTALGHGVAIPHIYSPALRSRLCVVAQVPDGVEFDAPDGEPVRLAFLLLSPPGDAQGHLVALAEIARLAWDPEMRARLIAADPSELFAIVRGFNPNRHTPVS